jgi:hypothetical protein
VQGVACVGLKWLWGVRACLRSRRATPFALQLQHAAARRVLTGVSGGQKTRRLRPPARAVCSRSAGIALDSGR